MLAITHHVLVVEDDPTRRTAISRALRLYGYAVTEVPDAAAALDHLGDCYDTGPPLPDAVVAAIRLPVVTGIHLLATICGLPEPIPVILIGDALHDEARRLGATAVLRTPLDLDAVCGAVDHAVAREEVASIVDGLVRALSSRSRVRVAREGRAVRVSVVDEI